MTFPFRFEPTYRLVAMLFGVTPRNAGVEVADGWLLARFGRWSVETPMRNVVGSEVTGPYGRLRTVGPAHLSLVDKGLTFASNAGRGLCIRFRDPVPGIEPTGRLLHPGLTVTVEDLDGLARALLTGPSAPA